MGESLAQFWNDSHAKAQAKYPGRTLINFADFQAGARRDAIRNTPGTVRIAMELQEMKNQGALDVANANNANQPNRTPSQEHLDHLNNLYGSGEPTPVGAPPSGGGSNIGRKPSDRLAEAMETYGIKPGTGKREQLTDLERMLYMEKARFPGIIGLNNNHLTSLANQRSSDANTPNRTPSAEHLEHLRNTGGGSRAPAPKVPREGSSIGNVAFGPDSPEEDDRDGVFGPLRANRPPTGMRRF